MQTSELVSHIIASSNNGVTRAAALQLISIAQSELMEYNNLFTQELPEPSLITTAGTLTYTLPAGIRTVTRGYIDLGHGVHHYVNFYCPVGYDQYAPLIITFNEDPGNSIIKLEAYRWAPILTSESIPLSMPPKHQTGVLKTRVMAMIEETNFGNSVYWRQLLKEEIADWRSQSSQGNNALLNQQVTPVSFYG